MELVRYVPLYYVVMPQFIIIVTEFLFVSTLIHIVDGVGSRPQIPIGTKFVSLHEDIPKEVNKVFVSQPLDPGGGGSDPLGPLRPLGLPIYFGLPMATITTKQTYHRPLNYHEYVKDFDPYVNVRVFKATNRVK
jgi:hypothetical protein